MKPRVKQDWMGLDQESIDGLEEYDWKHYEEGGCLCFAHSDSECLCGAWWKEETKGNKQY